MNKASFGSFTATLEEITRLLKQAVTYAASAIGSVTWPTLLVACVLLALIITVIPLAIGLFAVLMIGKLIFGAVSDRVERGAPTAYKPVEPSAPVEPMRPQGE